MLTATSNAIVDELSEKMERNDLVLPAMPAWATNVVKMLDNIALSAGKVASAVTPDPVFVAQLLKTANGAFYASMPKVDNINIAVARVGYGKLRNLVISISIAELSTMEKPALKKHLAKFRNHGREVAAIGYVLAKSQKHLNQDQAMLAGLVHDIGKLPLLLFLEDKNPPADGDTITTVTRKYGALAGERLLKLWKFPPDLIEVPRAHADIHRNNASTRASYADVVTVANMLIRSDANAANWNSVPAVKHMGLATEFYRGFFDRFEYDLTAAREMLA